MQRLQGDCLPLQTPAAHRGCPLAHPPCRLPLLSGGEEEAEEAATKLHFLRMQEGLRGDALPSSVFLQRADAPLSECGFVT